MKSTLFFFLTVFFLRSSAQNPINWQVGIGGNDTEYSNGIDTATDGSIYSAGVIRSRTGEYLMQYTNSPDPLSYDAWIVKYNKHGVMQWQKTFGGTQPDEFYDVKATADGGAIAVGRSGSADGQITNNKGGEDIIAVKYDAAGNMEWNQNYGTSLLDGARTVIVMPDGSYVLGCYSNGINKDLIGGKGLRDAWLIQISSTGTIMRKKNFGGSSDDDPYDIKFINNDTWLVTGSTGSTNGDVTGLHGSSDVWALKLDAAWNLQKQKCFGGTAQDLGVGIVALPDGYAVAARTSSASGDVTGFKGSFDGWIIKTDVNLNTIWTKTYGGTAIDYFNTLTTSTDGNLIAAGETSSTSDDISSNAGLSDAWLVKIDAATGTKIWSKTYGETKADRANDVITWADDQFLFSGMLSLVVSVSNIHPQMWVASSRQFQSASPLPVRLILFDGKQVATNNVLTWKTSSEVDSKKYIVERSVDGFNFTNIGVVTAAGNSSTLQSYQFIDRQPLTISWYRLRIVDRSGVQTFSPVLHVKTKGGNDVLKLYPSIASSSITLEKNSVTTGIITMLIADAAGKICQKQEKNLNAGNNKFLLDVSALPHGLYYIQTTDGSKAETSKFIKE